jgi:hypothetical protein
LNATAKPRCVRSSPLVNFTVGNNSSPTVGHKASRRASINPLQVTPDAAAGSQQVGPCICPPPPQGSRRMTRSSRVPPHDALESESAAGLTDTVAGVGSARVSRIWVDGVSQSHRSLGMYCWAALEPGLEGAWSVDGGDWGVGVRNYGKREKRVRGRTVDGRSWWSGGFVFFVFLLLVFRWVWVR